MAKKRKWWPDSILGRFVVGLVLAWIVLGVAISLFALLAQESISPSSSGSSEAVQTVKTTETLP